MKREVLCLLLGMLCLLLGMITACGVESNPARCQLGDSTCGGGSPGDPATLASEWANANMPSYVPNMAVPPGTTTRPGDFTCTGTRCYAEIGVFGSPNNLLIWCFYDANGNVTNCDFSWGSLARVVIPSVSIGGVTPGARCQLGGTTCGGGTSGDARTAVFNYNATH